MNLEYALIDLNNNRDILEIINIFNKTKDGYFYFNQYQRGRRGQILKFAIKVLDNLDKTSIRVYLNDNKNNEFIGKSQGLQISKAMFDWVSNGNSLNKVIESIIENSENKKSNGISGYLTNGFYKRDIFDSSAIISAIQSYINYNQSYQQLARRLTK